MYHDFTYPAVLSAGSSRKAWQIEEALLHNGWLA